MLPKERRATTQHIQTAIKKGSTQHSELFSIRYIKTHHPTKVAVVVSKKIGHTAVVRNKLKRRIKNILRSLVLPKNKTIIFYTKKGVLHSSVSELKKELLRLIS